MCPSDMIENCFNHCMKFAAQIGEIGREGCSKAVIEHMERKATEHGVTFARKTLERHGGLFDEAREGFSNCQRLARTEKRASMKQTTIFDHTLTT